MAEAECYGGHRFFCAEVVGSESEGKVFVLAICTACGELKNHVVQVGAKGQAIRLLKEEKAQSLK
jgi:hypothetical protein